MSTVYTVTRLGVRRPTTGVSERVPSADACQWMAVNGSTERIERIGWPREIRSIRSPNPLTAPLACDLRPVVPVDTDVLVAEIARPDRGLPAAQAQVHGHRDFRPGEDGAGGLLRVAERRARPHQL